MNDVVWQERMLSLAASARRQDAVLARFRWLATGRTMTADEYGAALAPGGAISAAREAFYEAEEVAEQAAQEHAYVARKLRDSLAVTLYA